MKKKRRYLKDLIPVNINSLVLETGYYEIQIGGIHLSLAPERMPNGSYVVSLFINNQRQEQVWELSTMPHGGRLRNGGFVPYRCDERYFVLSGGRRFSALFIDPETMMIGTRIDFYPHHWAAYPRGKAKEESKSFQDQCRAMEKELFGEDEWEAFHKRTVLKSRLGI